MSIFDVEHQVRAHRILQRALASERMPHAYLFAGPEGVGREMLALRLAHVLLCSDRQNVPVPDDLVGSLETSTGIDACGVCRDCQLVGAGTHNDLFTIYRQLNKQHPDTVVRRQKALFLGVEVIRHFVIERVGMKPQRGRAKVFIIREAERLNDAAQNSLLKTLEEPPADTFLILLTSALENMLPTTVSRCQRVLFNGLPTPFVEQKLAELCPGVADDERQAAARLAQGSLGTARRCLDDGLVELQHAWTARLGPLCAGDPRVAPQELAGPLLADAKNLAKAVIERDPDVSETDATRAGIRQLLRLFADHYRQGLRASIGVANTQDALGLSRRLSAYHLRRGIDHLAEAETHINRNAHLELAMEGMFIRLAGLHREPVRPRG